MLFKLLASVPSVIVEIKYNIKVRLISLDFSSTEEIDKKIFSQKVLLEEIQGVFFPIGTMFEQDGTMVDQEQMRKLIHSNFLSIAYTIQNLRKFLINKKDTTIVGFGSVSSFLGRKVNSIYAGSKRALESYFESLAFDKDFKRINIQFYTLGYLDTNLSFGKDLKLPKGSIEKLSNIVFENKNLNFKTLFYPKYWKIINLIIKLVPFPILRKLAEILNK